VTINLLPGQVQAVEEVTFRSRTDQDLHHRRGRDPDSICRICHSRSK
jgi:hypothetical protein